MWNLNTLWTNNNILKPSKLPLKIKWVIISIWWKVFHILFSMWDKSIENTAKWYLDITWTNLNIDQESISNIEYIKNKWCWIIISNHIDFTFADYLWLFSAFWKEILDKVIYYTWVYNLNMNKREFPNNEFRQATKINIESLLLLKNDIKEINSWNWYIFIIPSWDDETKNAKFKWIFKKIIELSEDDLPILVNYIEHFDESGKINKKSYINIILSLLNKNWWITNVTSKLFTASDFKLLSWAQMRTKYNQMFNSEIK